MIPRITPSHDVVRSLRGASSQVVWAAHGHVGPVIGTPAVPREAAWCKTTIMKTTWALCTAARKTAPMSMRAALRVKKRLDNLRLRPGTASLSVVTIAQKTVFVTQSRQSKYYCLVMTPSVCLIYSWPVSIFLPEADIIGVWGYLYSGNKTWFHGLHLFVYPVACTPGGPFCIQHFDNVGSTDVLVDSTNC